MNKDSKNRGFNGVPFLMFIVIVFGSLWFMGKMQQPVIGYTLFFQHILNLIDIGYIHPSYGSAVF